MGDQLPVRVISFTSTALVEVFPLLTSWAKAYRPAASLIWTASAGTLVCIAEVSAVEEEEVCDCAGVSSAETERITLSEEFADEGSPIGRGRVPV